MTDPGSRLASSWRSAHRAASGLGGKAQILCFGDSLVKLGLLPRVLEERIGSSAYNLAVLGGQAPSSYFLFRHVLEQGHRPRAVIVNFSALLLAMEPRVNAAWWSALADRGDRLELAWRTCDPTLAASMIVPDLIASWSARDVVRMTLRLDRSTGSEDRARPDDLRVFERNWRLNQGAQVAPRRFVSVAGSRPRPSDANNWMWRPQLAHAFYVERFLILAQSFQIPVYWVLTPATSHWRERNERSGTTPAYRQFVRGYLSRFPGLTVLDGQHLTWDRWAFRDPIHLNRDGALRLSLTVADSVAAQPGSLMNQPRWIELDGTEHQPSGQFQDLLEDLDQSRLVVNQLGRGESGMEGSRR
jgi:hypothetical protein